MWMGQPLYTDTFLRKFGMDQAKPIKTPVNVSEKLTQADEEFKKVDQAVFQSAVSSLLYLSTCTRSDIAYAVSNVAKFCSKPTTRHWSAVKRILRYLRGTFDYGLQYVGDGLQESVGYSDADWAGEVDNYKSTSGYVGEAENKQVWRYQQQKPNIWP